MLRRAIVWAFGGQLATFALSFGGSVAIARLLSPHELGIYAVAMAALGILQIVTSFGTAAFIVKEITLHEKALDTAFTVNALLAVLLALILVFASYPVASFLHEDAVRPVLQLLALTPILSIFEFRPATMLQRDMQFKVISMVGAVKTAVGITVTLTTAYLGASYLSPAYGALAASIVGLGGFLVYGRRHFSLRLSSHGWKPMAIFGLQMMSVSGVASASTRLSDIIMGRLLGLEALGLFARANNLSGQLISNIYGTATRVIFVKLSQDYRETGVIRDTFLPSLRLVTAVMGPLTIGLSILSAPIVYNLYGQKWIAAAPVLAVLMIGQFISLSFAMNWELFVIRNELGVQTKFEVIRSILGVIVRAIGSIFSILSTAFAWVVEALFSFWLYAPHIRRLAEARHGELTGIYLETTGLTSAACVPSLVTMVVYDWRPDLPLIPVLASTLLGILLWMFVLYKIQHPLWIESRAFIRAGLSKLST